jgi:beta-lactamase regulating signal transducer with metallopeptidase domain
MTELAQHPAVQALASALAHFLWQGGAIAAAAALLMRQSSSASVRYATGVGALVAMLAAPIATFVAVQAPHDAAAALPAGVFERAAVAASPPSSHAVDSPGSSNASLAVSWPLVGVVTWMLGMFILSLRLAGGWVVARRMATRAVRPAAAHIQVMAAGVAARLSLRRAVNVFESPAVAVPVLVGWLQPAVVFPVAALAGLSPAQIEALLAHELAHVRRHDYLVNLLQSFAEVVLFYHPAMWWLSRRVRAERELCCDDVAVGVCDRLVYATALTDLAAMMSPRVALAATGGDLLARVRRILQREEPSMIGKVRSVAATIVFVAMCVALPALVASVRPAARAVAADTASLQPAGAPFEAVPESPSAPTQDNPQSADELVATYAALLNELTALTSMNAVADQSAEQARENEIEALRRNLEEQKRRNELEVAKSQHARARRMFETGLLSASDLARAELDVARLEAGGDREQVRSVEIEGARRQLADAKRRVEVGLLAPDELVRLEVELAMLQAGDDSRKVLAIEQGKAQRDLEARQRLFERGLVTREQVDEARARASMFEQGKLAEEVRKSLEEQGSRRAEVERLIREVEERKGQTDERRNEIERLLAARERDLARTTERRRDETAAVLAQTEQRRRDVEVDRQRMMEETAARRRELQRDQRDMSDVVSRRARASVEGRPEAYDQVAPRPIAAGDFLFVSIAGESDLPSIYRIDSSGSIRIPLLGTFKVIGQTPDQVREAVGRKLSESRLGSAGGVRVAIRRMRTAR